MEEGIKITSNLSEICNNSVVLCKYGEIVIPAYVLNNFNNIYYLYAQIGMLSVIIMMIVLYLSIWLFN